ncbi:MAG TPA: hypothetical protein VGY97_01045 [Solirubrobacteraceae bacterium]|nr:hypothetical protein [Solirubrobacteraceae bacterium]
MRFGSSALLLVLIMFVGSLVLWIGIPLGWLWIASQVQSATDSLGAALGAALFGVVVSIALMIPVLNWLSNKHREVQIARGHQDTGHLVLEMVMVTSAGLAIVLFGAWFFLLSGSSPIPVDLHY